MKVIIIADMEGVSGITVWEQVIGGQAMYEEGRRLYTAEINAAIKGARQAGAEEVLVVDCHGAGGAWNFNSLIPEKLDHDCDWVSHHPWSKYSDLLEQGYDAAVLIGMHSKAGTPNGVMAHTISTTGWVDLRFNETSVGEIGIHAAVCGHYKVPIVAVSGDAAACHEASQLLGSCLMLIPVKTGLSLHSARNVSPLRAQELIQAQVRQALLSKTWPPPFIPSRPTRITVRASSTETVSKLRLRQEIDIVDPITVVSRGDTWIDAWNQIWDQ